MLPVSPATPGACIEIVCGRSVRVYRPEAGPQGGRHDGCHDSRMALRYRARDKPEATGACGAPVERKAPNIQMVTIVSTRWNYGSAVTCHGGRSVLEKSANRGRVPDISDRPIS